MSLNFFTTEAKLKSLKLQVESAKDPGAILSSLSRDLKSIFDCEALALFSLDEKKKTLTSIHISLKDNHEIQVVQNSRTPVGHAAQSGRPVMFGDTKSKADITLNYPEMELKSSLELPFKIPTKSLMALAVSHDRRVLGAVEFTNKVRGDGFSAEDLKQAKALIPTLVQLLTKLKKGPAGTESPSSPVEGNDGQQKLVRIINKIHSAKNVDEILLELKKSIMDVFNAEMITIYAVDSSKNEIFSKIKSGKGINEIRLAISPDSIAGCVAQERRILSIQNAYDKSEVKAYHPKLEFDQTWDKKSGTRTRSMLAASFQHKGKLMGVLQLINKKGAQKFSSTDEKFARLIGETLALAFTNQTKFIPPKPTKFSYLLMNGVISDRELNAAIATARKSQLDIEAILLDQLGVSRKDLGASLESFFKIPYYGYNASIVLPSHLFEGLNLAFLIKNYWVPISRDSDRITILVDNPMNADKIQNIRRIFPKLEIDFKIGLKADIRDFLNSIAADERVEAGVGREEMSSLLEALKTEREVENITAVQDDDDVNAITETDSTIVRLVNKILTDAYDQSVSDIHVEPGIGKDNMEVRFRKDGICRLYQEIPAMYKQALISRLKIMARLDIAERRLPQDGKIKMRYGSKEIEYRIATCPTHGGNEDAVLRILAASKPIPLDKLSFTKRNLKMIKIMAKKPYGLILAVGPTGSGKTTTLHSMLGYINNREKKIWTAEDPVEITQKGLRQVQMLPKIGLDFARAMRSFLRGDPDVIMVGEMRDAETCSIGLEASLTGHLVFSTLHTNTAPETITRLLDMGMNPLNFADALLLIVSQRLVRTLCKNCKEEYHPTSEEFEQLTRQYGAKAFEALQVKHTADLRLFRPKGCSNCMGTGYSGRMGLHEVLVASESIKRLIMKHALVEEIRNQAIQDGMTTLKQDGIQKVLQGHCDLKQVLAVSIL